MLGEGLGSRRPLGLAHPSPANPHRPPQGRPLCPAVRASERADGRGLRTGRLESPLSSPQTSSPARVARLGSRHSAAFPRRVTRGRWPSRAREQVAAAPQGPRAAAPPCAPARVPAPRPGPLGRPPPAPAPDPGEKHVPAAPRSLVLQAGTERAPARPGAQASVATDAPIHLGPRWELGEPPGRPGAKPRPGGSGTLPQSPGRPVSWFTSPHLPLGSPGRRLRPGRLGPELRSGRGGLPSPQPGPPAPLPANVRGPAARGLSAPGGAARAPRAVSRAALAGAARPAGAPRPEARPPPARGRRAAGKAGPDRAARPRAGQAGEPVHRPGSKACPLAGATPGLTRGSRNRRKGGCGRLRRQLFVVSLFPPARGLGFLASHSGAVPGGGQVWALGFLGRPTGLTQFPSRVASQPWRGGRGHPDEPSSPPDGRPAAALHSGLQARRLPPRRK